MLQIFRETKFLLVEVPSVQTPFDYTLFFNGRKSRFECKITDKKTGQEYFKLLDGRIFRDRKNENKDAFELVTDPRTLSFLTGKSCHK